MIKTEALDALDAILQKKWKEAKQAFENSRASATGEAVKQESKYDTRGLEEAYLAHGLANAVVEYEQAINDLNACRIATITKSARLGSLIECKREGQSVYFVISASGGGIEAETNGHEVTIITPESPLAKKLLNLSAGDRISSPAFKIEKVS